jgi:hypothetical protein
MHGQLLAVPAAAFLQARVATPKIGRSRRVPRKALVGWPPNRRSGLHIYMCSNSLIGLTVSDSTPPNRTPGEAIATQGQTATVALQENAHG